MLIATLIAADQLQKGELSSAADRLTGIGGQITRIGDVVDGKTADIVFEGDLPAARKTLPVDNVAIDFVVQHAEHREKKLLISDMDSTMITVECIDELAGYAGIKDQIAEITERAMLGELDFEEALRGRVALLAGLELSAIDQCLDEKVELMPGAKTLVRTMAGRGAKTILVSGGFTRFADPVAKAIGFASAEANILAETDGILTGKLDGPVVDAQRKADLLRQSALSAGLSLEQCIAVGDGANDIPMIALAGMGVAYHAKPKAAAAADLAIKHNDLSALLYVQGIASEDWMTD
ncbi:phosphoserine phosphatase SerB [Parasphingorhabdus litoris]|uniref:Phosphoserine phosphatase n=1 Tax=Parasphingorhabdus litoris TaxID=394733 RepID=A0ABN1ASZ0_9SPHN|nr:phosphoserine phosphatase SerB [Parasphingorhabdus litoris]